MQWVVLFLICAVASTLACLTVGCLARLLSLAPWAGLRKWIVIFSAFLLILPVAWLIITAVYFPDDYQDLWHIVVNDYRELPTYTLLLVVPAAVGGVFFLAALVGGFLPEPLIPYEPRAAYWSLRGLIGWLGLMTGLAIVALVWQDIALQASLREQQAEAESVARQLAPEAVAEADNAAVHYQRVVDMMDGINKWRDEGDYDDLVERLLKCDVEDEKFEEYFQRLKPMFDELRLAAKCSECRFDEKYVPLHIIDGMDARYALVTAMQLARQMSNYRACQGRPAEAVEHLELIRRYVVHLGNDPRAREGVFYYWCEGWIRQGVEHLVTHSEELPAKDLRRLISTDSLPAETIYREGIQWHAAAIQRHLVNIYIGAEFERDGFRFDEAFGDRNKRKLPRWLLLAGMRTTTQRDEMAALEATFPFIVRPEDDGAWEPHWDEATPSGNLVSRALSISYLPHWVDRSETDRRLTNIAVAAALYRQDEGKWPESLDVLAPKYLAEIPRPAEGEEPFRVKSIDGGLMVYSADLDKLFGKFEDKEGWWQEVAEGATHYGDCLFLGRARHRLIEFERFW
jgi:hypothetical protein